jgi:hypothetical protein
MTPDLSLKKVQFNSVEVSGQFVYYDGSRSVLNLLGLPSLSHRSLFIYSAFKPVLGRPVYLITSHYIYLSILNYLLVDTFQNSVTIIIIITYTLNVTLWFVGYFQLYVRYILQIIWHC